MTADIRTAAQREHEFRLVAQVEANRQREGLHHESIRGSLARKAGFIDGAVWGAARVTHTRERLGQVIEQHEYDFDLEMCSCGWDQNTAPDSDFERHQADAVLEYLASGKWG